MRTISYNEYILNIKSDFYYVNLAYNIKHNKNYFTNILFKEEEHFEKFHNQHPLNTFIEYIEVLVYDNILSASEIIKIFKLKEISDNYSYCRLQEYISIYENRQMLNDFPFKFKMDIETLIDKFNSVKDKFNICKSQFEYIPYDLTAPTYEELMEYYKNSELYDRVKKLYLNKPIIVTYIKEHDYIESYQYEKAKNMFNIFQIFIEECLLTNTIINKLLSKEEAINFTEYKFLFDYLDEFLYIKNTNWHKYTLEIDVDMLINKVLYYYHQYEDFINKERFNAIFEKYNIKVDYNIPLEQRHELDMFYREKYRKLYEAELKEKANK
jgi:hypothetical protein